MEDMVETIQPDSNLARWRRVENLMGIVAQVKPGDCMEAPWNKSCATCDGQHINGCARSCRSVFAALSCT